MQVRLFQESDVEKLVDLHHRAVRHAGTPFYTPRQIEAWTSQCCPERFTDCSADKITYVATDENTILGFSEVGLDRLNQRCTLETLYVDPEVQRRGVGTLLLKRIERTAMMNHLSEILVDAAYNAIEFYKKAGFIYCGNGWTLMNDVRVGHYKMRKTLDTQVIDPDAILLGMLKD